MNQFLASLIIIFFPGIIAALIVDRIIFHKEWDLFKFSIRAFVLGISSYGLLQLFYWLIHIVKFGILSAEPFISLKVWEMLAKEKTEIPFNEVFYGLIASVFVAFFVAAIIHRKFFNIVAKKFNITNIYGSESLFTYFLNLKDIDWIYIRDSEQCLSYRGELSFFNEFEDMQEIILRNVTVYSGEEVKECYSMEQIYLCKRNGSISIEVPKKQEQTPNVTVCSCKEAKECNFMEQIYLCKRNGSISIEVPKKQEQTPINKEEIIYNTKA